MLEETALRASRSSLLSCGPVKYVTFYLKHFLSRHLVLPAMNNPTSLSEPLIYNSGIIAIFDV